MKYRTFAKVYELNGVVKVELDSFRDQREEDTWDIVLNHTNITDEEFASYAEMCRDGGWIPVEVDGDELP